jgi:hypothetical protein
LNFDRILGTLDPLSRLGQNMSDSILGVDNLR